MSDYLESMSTPTHCAGSDASIEHLDAGAPKLMLCVYLGLCTVVFGRGGVTVHGHTRGTLDTRAAYLGFGRVRKPAARQR